MLPSRSITDPWQLLGSILSALWISSSGLPLQILAICHRQHIGIVNQQRSIVLNQICRLFISRCRFAITPQHCIRTCQHNPSLAIVWILLQACGKAFIISICSGAIGPFCAIWDGVGAVMTVCSRRGTRQPRTTQIATLTTIAGIRLPVSMAIMPLGVSQGFLLCPAQPRQQHEHQCSSNDDDQTGGNQPKCIHLIFIPILN